MGLLLGVGKTKPEFAYDYYYGIEWNYRISNPHPKRIGRIDLHRTLPIQSKMRCCLLRDDGTVNYYLDAFDSTKRTDGSAADLTGAAGQFMVEIPEMYVKFEKDGDVCRAMMSDRALPGFKHWQKCYVSAVEATVQRSTLKLASVVNEDEDYRGGNGNSSWDGTYRSLLGRPASMLTLTKFRQYARNRNEAATSEWNAYMYQVHRRLCWLFAIEYCNFNSQEDFTTELTDEGFHKGGLGAGVTNLTSSKLSGFNTSYPFIPCGFLNSLGNQSGCLDYVMPFEYDATAANYAGEYNAEIAYVSGQYVSSGEMLYKCIADALAGTGLDNAEFFEPVTRTVVSANSYRGVRLPFGHIYKMEDGCKFSSSKVYVCDNPEFFSTSASALDNYTRVGNTPLGNGYVKRIILGENGDTIASNFGGSSTTYFCDSIYNTLASNYIFGGLASDGAAAGFFCAYTYAFANTYCGSRLCFYPQIE